ncbi:M1 family metallopeptidase [Cognatitamlana onchidii]|uniref:M1 family metallopeptidase n=1 Tax=Cognatitamlana onchidii TaxID=2562860 RepID=UPI0010A5B9B0|nr:M1 family metallopeptidase [Algibacter onchidii]
MNTFSSFIAAFLFLFNLQAQQVHNIDFQSVQASISFGDVVKNEVLGSVKYYFKVLKDVDSVYLDGQNLTYSKILLKKIGEATDYQIADLQYINTAKHLVIYNAFKKEDVFQLEISYSGTPQKALYFIDWEYSSGNRQIWTQGQGKYTSSWFPSIDDMNEKMEFDIAITFNKDYEVIANGKLAKKQLEDSTITWYYDMKQPMSSYLLALAIGKYNKKVIVSNSGVPLEMYYYPEDSLKFEPTYRYTKEVFDFLEDEIGVPYPWQNYKMVPVKDFLYAGMENTSMNIYSDAFVIDSIAFTDKNFVNINAHELAHQWFGDLVTETSGTHHWLQEGFATYYALLAEKEIFGEDYYYWRLYQYAQELLEQDKAGQSTALLNPKSSSTTFYKKGAWALHMLRNYVGDMAFRKGVRSYLKKHQFKNVETSDFITEIESASKKDLSKFVANWLAIDSFYYDACMKILEEHSKAIKQFSVLSKEIKLSSQSPNKVANTFFEHASYVEVKARLFSKSIIKLVDDYTLFKKALSIHDIKLRQAIAKSLSNIPSSLKKDYESLLFDKSYETIEAALFNLWRSFPQDRKQYLDKTKSLQGFRNKNIRLLWLVLALITEDYDVDKKHTYYNELIEYSSPKYGFEIRMNAFQYLKEIQACNDDCKAHLKQATAHHNWQFKKFAKALLKD